MRPVSLTSTRPPVVVVVTVDQQRDGRLHERQPLGQLAVGVAEAGQRDRAQHRVDRAPSPGSSRRARRDRRSGAPTPTAARRRSLDRLIVERDQRHGRVQEGPLADDAAVGAGARAQQQRRRVDRAAREHDPLARVDDQPAARAIGGAIEHVGDDGAGAAAIGLDQLDAAVGVDVRAGGDRVGEEGGARRPLGVERAAQAAVAEPRAALDAAADQLGAASPACPAPVQQLAVVGVDVVGVAGADVQARLDGGEVRLQRRGVEVARCRGARPTAAASRAGVRNDEVQLTVVPPPTLRPCRIMIARSSVARLPCSW